MEAMFKPAEIAKRLRVKPETVLRWIRLGELRALNTADRNRRRPRFKIDPQALADFELARAVVPDTWVPRRRRRLSAGVIEFFPSSAA